LKHWWWVGQKTEDLSGDVALETADDLLGALALGPALSGLPPPGAGVPPSFQSKAVASSVYPAGCPIRVPA
jgi:hypothetical protein